MKVRASTPHEQLRADRLGLLGQRLCGQGRGDHNDKQTSETAMLFLMLIMRKLRRQPKPGRAGVVVPNGTLFAGGVAARIKEELLKEFNLHTVVRLSNGVFAPYTSIPTNLLFFDRSGPTHAVWYRIAELMAEIKSVLAGTNR